MLRYRLYLWSYAEYSQNTKRILGLSCNIRNFLESLLNNSLLSTCVNKSWNYMAPSTYIIFVVLHWNNVDVNHNLYLLPRVDQHILRLPIGIISSYGNIRMWPSLFRFRRGEPICLTYLSISTAIFVILTDPIGQKIIEIWILLPIFWLYKLRHITRGCWRDIRFKCTCN